MAEQRQQPAVAPDPPPPMLGSWRNLYLLVIGELALLVALFYALTRWAA
ncbi:MAG: hypothetical protein ABI629_08905 [bacterium]